MRPRLVLVTRKSPLELLLARLGTYGQARFYVESRQQRMDWYEAVHERLQRGIDAVVAGIPSDQRSVHVDRDMLDRFLFAPDDVIVVIGQDGLVANVAKYLDGQLTVGINPDPQRYDGILCPHGPTAFPDLLRWIDQRGPRYALQARAMAEAVREDGQCVLALNEVFIGHASHQSARYRLTVGDRAERQSSSGLIVATGTGSTGWARSIAEQRGLPDPLPAPDEPSLAWFVREPFPSVATGTALNAGRIGTGETIGVASEMGEGGVVFADGIESDAVEFLAGQSIRVGLSARRLNLVVERAPTAAA